MDLLMVIEGEFATTHLIERILLACEAHGISYRKKFLSDLKIQDIDSDTTVFFVRCGDPIVEYWVYLLSRANHPFIYYIDDNFWKIQGDSPLALYYQHPIIRRALRFAVTHANSVLTNSDELAKFLLDFNKRIQILPAFFDFSLINDRPKKSLEEIRIGFAGSPSRVKDLDLIQMVIFPVLNLYQNVVFEFAGVMPHGIQQSDRIRFFPHTQNYSEFIKFQSERNWSIGLAPLHDNEANRCKTNNKYREYGACKIAGIYSDMSPYKNSVVEGVTGLMVDNSPEAWLEAINRLLINPAECKEIGERAYEHVRQNYCIERVSMLWANYFKTIDRHRCSCQSISLQSVSRRAKIKKIQSKIDSFRMQIFSAYIIGGTSLVIKKSVVRIIKIIWNKKIQKISNN